MPPEDPPQDPTTAIPPVGAESYISGLVAGTVRQKQTEAVRPPASSFGIAPGAVPARVRPRTIACMVTHGMGQQVPFETAASISEAFRRGRAPSAVPQANRVHLSTAPDCALVTRMELIYAAQDGEPETHVHIYEGYWAPLTEGKITYAQSLSFLFTGAFAGLKSSISRKFNRWIFGEMRDLHVKKHTFFVLLLVLLVLAFGLLLAFLGGLQLAHLYGSLKLIAIPSIRQAPRVLLNLFLAHKWANLRTLALIVAALVYRYVLNLFVIQYLGDVAIYVSSYKVSAFEDIRNAIQKIVITLGQQIFQAKDSATGEPLYDGVIFVGHSLGSVITYDLINALIVWDTHGCDGEHNVVGRIHRFITFGSPLDKTAFLFRNQPSEDQHYREAMAGLMQAMVLDYALRPFPWVNLYSHRDIVSGCLEYYDTPPELDPQLPGYNHVDNREDPAARTWIVAHTQYWGGKELSRELLAGLVPPPK